jgi:serine/threonine protein kinase/Tol biopolymer transport system component
MSIDRQNEKEIFETAVKLTTPGERVAYLDRVCSDDPAHKARVFALLQAHESGHHLLDPLLDESNISRESGPTEGPGTVIGRYKLLEKIGEGGMAVVYMAEQTEPIRRKVALKIIKLGMDTRQVIARFEAERQALALMDHPSIAKVLDAGATETGRPYFVMELVQGVSITEYCDKNNLNTKDRLALFLQVCHAVQHAHQKGIIHRDIKPSNVMVTHRDGRPVPKVIDFGIAKATNQRLTEKTLFTRYAHIIGTPAYMSPEQAELSDLDIDTRTDIYSLGVLLYELLTGTTPFSEEELRKAGYIEMQRVIREQEPAKPSTKLSTIGETVTDIAKHRGCTPDLLRRTIRGDLDWIVMKTLEKDRGRRYETPNALASDILRHLEHEPVLARGPSTTYRLQKLLRRHRAQVLAGVGITVVVAAAAVVLSMWNRDRLQLAEAEGLRHRAILSQAREQYARAERDAALETIQPILHSKHVGPEARLLQAGILVDNRRSDEAVTILGGLLAEKPAIAGTAHSLLARILWESESPNAEKLKEIEDHRRQAEALLPKTAEAYFLRAMTAVTVKEQLASLDKALHLDPSHYESRRLRAFTYYASRKYEKMEDDAVAMTVLRPRDPLGYSLRAVAWRELGRYPEAVADYDVAIGLTPQDDPQHVDLSIQRCETLLRVEEYKRVIADAQACFKLWADKPVFQYHTFCALTALGEYDKAAILFRQIIAPGHAARRQFQDWCARYVFDTLEAGKSWHPPDRETVGPAFLPMVEAEETYRSLSAKGKRVITDGFTAHWSPDGSKLAFSLGVHGYSGVALFDPPTKETELLTVPGKDPIWSPDGRYIAFVRDREVLRLEDLATAERENRDRPVTDEEVWIMKADGTEPRRLARGGWPSWSQDSTCVYYQSRVDKVLYSISIVEPDAGPKRIMVCSNGFPSVSPDGRRVAYLEGTSLVVKDLASQALITRWPVPPTTWGGPAWSLTGTELYMGTGSAANKMGLWIYQLDRSEPVKTLDGPIVVSSWSPDGKKLIFTLGPPYFEIWSADLDPEVPAIEALGPARTLREHYQEMLDLYTRRIEADPLDAYAYSGRAQCYDYLHDWANATADMRRWSLAAGGHQPSDLQFATLRDFPHVIDLPFDCQVVLSAERPVNEIPVMSIAFGQKGRWEMKLCEIPVFVVSLCALGLLSGLDTPSAYADFAFGTPVNLELTIPVLDALHDSIDCFSADGLEMYVESDRSTGYGSWDLWVSRRTSTDTDWGPLENLGATLNTAKGEGGACISADGLTLYFGSTRSGGYGSDDIYMTTRTTTSAPWGSPVNLGPTINGTARDGCPWLSPDGLELYFNSVRSDGYGGWDLYVARRETTTAPWGQAENLGPVVNTAYSEAACSLSPDGLLLLFSEPYNIAVFRPGGYGGGDIWMTRRASLSAPWQTPVNLGPQVNGPGSEVIPRLSSDGSALYFSRYFGGVWDNWQVPIVPVVDFNGDGKVDGKEVLGIAEHWGQDKSAYDIGPTPIGNGVVDANDLIVLADYIGTEWFDPTLLAHWALDEVGGSVAMDSAGQHDAMVVGTTVWQPEGKVGGALAFDGKTNFARTMSPVLDPVSGPFSVIAWVQGGAAGRVIVSQVSGVDWLYLNQYGMLTTDLKASGTSGTSLSSDAHVLDDQWHRVVMTWDGTNRALYLDDIEVARDTQTDLKASSGNLVIGAGKTLTPASFWTGLIDDVRIYNRAVSP